MRVEGVHIDALGVDLHEWISVEKAAEDGLLAAETHADTGLTGVYVAPEVPALDMAVNSARTALDRAKTDPEAIATHIHSSVNYQAPAGSYPPGYVLRELGLGTIPAFYLQQGCNGMLSAMEVAIGQITGAGEAEAVLLTTGENWNSPGINRWTDGQNQSCILGDGGASVLLSAHQGFAEVRSLNAGVLHRLEKWHRGDGPLINLESDAASEMAEMGERVMRFHDADLSMAETLEKMSVFDLEIMQRSLVDAGLNASDITKVVSLNVDGRVVEYTVMVPLGVPMSRSGWEFGKSVGHIGGADPFIALEHLVRTREVTAGDHVLLTSQGPGWICTAAVVTINETPAWAVA
ncbi:ketoacyl-ACP synthase III family protein [Streptomyces sp. NBC_01231]|nr:ketoacyl-ACP synthase III family protein [Streptomyces sp. NBC_01231]